MKYDVIGFARKELDKYLELIGIDADISLHLFDELNITDEKILDNVTAEKKSEKTKGKR